jgi:head-tail adaptor
MAYGKMNTFIDIITTAPIKDAEGFVTKGDTVLASVRAYKEQQHGSEKWANMAAFSEATAMFRFRKIPGVAIDTTLFIADAEGRYNIVSVDDVRGRGMYVEVMAKEVKASGA